MDLAVLIEEHKMMAKGVVVDYDKYAFFAATHHSTAIEGSTLTASQAINLLE